MAISARCPACSKEYQLADDQAGQRVRCRMCRAEFEVPGRIETLESVPRDAMAGRPGPPPLSPLYEPLAPSEPRKSRKWKYVLGGLVVALLLLLLMCSGTVWMVHEEGPKALAQAEKKWNAKVDAAELEAKQANDRANKEKDRADKEKKKADEARDEAGQARSKAGVLEERIAALEVVAKAGKGVPGMEELLQQLARMNPEDLLKGLKGWKQDDLGKLLEGLKGLIELATAKVGPVKDVDDCVARLRSKNRAARFSAIKWIGQKQSFPDPQEKKKIIDALTPVAEDGEDPLLQKEAVFWKLALELDP